MNIVLEITNTSTSPELSSLFNRLLNIVLKHPESKISIVIYRIFRDMKSLTGIKFAFLNQILSEFSQNRTIFALSIIFQLTSKLSKVDSNLLQCPWRPWKVKFDGEKAIDMGVPTCELTTEASNTIFAPTTRLFILSPNGRRKSDENQDYYVPFCLTEEYLVH